MAFLQNPWEHIVHASCPKCGMRVNIDYIKGNKKLMTEVQYYCPSCGTVRFQVIKYLEPPKSLKPNDS